MREGEGPPAPVPRPLHDPVEPRCHLGTGLATGRRVGPDGPSGHRLPDLGRGQPLVVAVRPLGQVVGDLGVGEPGELGGVPRAPARAGQHQPEVLAGEPGAERDRRLLAVGQQRQVGDRRVPTLGAPLGRPVADQPQLGAGLRAHGHSLPVGGAAESRAPRAEPPGRRYRRITMKILLSAAAMAMALTALAGCSGDDDGDTATDPATKSDTTTEPTDPPDVGSYPELEATDYTYLLEQQCYCPLTGPVKVTVEDGEVTSSVILEGGQGMKKGSVAPDYLHLSINDVIARANDTECGRGRRRLARRPGLAEQGVGRPDRRRCRRRGHLCDQRRPGHRLTIPVCRGDLAFVACRAARISAGRGPNSRGRAGRRRRTCRRRCAGSSTRPCPWSRPAAAAARPRCR